MAAGSFPALWPGVSDAGHGPVPAGDESTRTTDATTPIPVEAPKASRSRASWQAVTTRGRVTALVAVSAGLLGLATGWREWIGIAAALAVLLVAAVLSAVGRSSCILDLHLPQTRLVVGDPGTASLVVRNTSRRRMLPLRIELDVDDGIDGTVGVTVPIPALRGGRSNVVRIPLPTQRRAVVRLGPLRAVRGDVFGLIRRVVQWPVPRRVFVHPRTARPGSSLPGFVLDLEGTESTARTASDLSFHTLREYVPGDDRRFINWKSSAHSGTLQVREFLQTRRSLIAVVLSGSPDDYYRGDGATDADVPVHDEEEFEVAVSCAASLVADLVRQRRHVITDAAGTAIRGATADDVLDQFSAIATAAASADLAFQTHQVVRRNPGVSLVVLVFGSTVGAAQVRAAVRSCPPGASVLGLRARVDSSPHPARLGRSEANSVLTVSTVEALPGALRVVR